MKDFWQDFKKIAGRAFFTVIGICIAMVGVLACTRLYKSHHLLACGAVAVVMFLVYSAYMTWDMRRTL